ncbi:MAG TPA: TIGR01459 family HAD-type hydrolase [Stellaceae bacterium]|nr:TIGR01459 family HAD-type hydrolase [Stellaceae bacterium]
MTVRILAGLRDIAAHYDGYVLDLWGVLFDGHQPTPGALDALRALRRAGKRTLVLSNAPRRAHLVERRMNEIGIPAGLYDHVHSSGEETWQHLKKRDDEFYASLGSACYHIGPQRDDNMVEGVGLSCVASVEDADFILNTGPGADEKIEDFEPMLQAARRRSLKMVCANPDLVVAYGDKLYLCGGSIAQRYEELGGTVRWHGKPLPDVYETAFKLLGISDKRRILAVGDSIRTDIAGANAAGIDSLFVATGIHAEELSAIDPQRLAAAFGAHGENPTAAIDYFKW